MLGALRELRNLGPKATPMTEACPVCKGVGWLRHRVPVGHPHFGKAVPCLCKRSEMDQKMAQRLREDANVSLLTLERQTFDSFDPGQGKNGQNGKDAAHASLVAAKYAAARFAENPAGWLVMCGSVGTGKSHLGHAIAGVLIERGTPIFWSSVPDLLGVLRRGFAQEGIFDKRLETLRTVDVLIMDDLGTEQVTDWVNEKLYQIINHRWQNRLPTVIITNLKLWEPNCGLAPRLRDRILDKGLMVGGQPVYLRAGSYRTS